MVLHGHIAAAGHGASLHLNVHGGGDGFPIIAAYKGRILLQRLRQCHREGKPLHGIGKARQQRNLQLQTVGLWGQRIGQGVANLQCVQACLQFRQGEDHPVPLQGRGPVFSVQPHIQRLRRQRQFQFFPLLQMQGKLHGNRAAAIVRNLHRGFHRFRIGDSRYRHPKQRNAHNDQQNFPDYFHLLPPFFILVYFTMPVSQMQVLPFPEI